MVERARKSLCGGGGRAGLQGFQTHLAGAWLRAGSCSVDRTAVLAHSWPLDAQEIARSLAGARPMTFFLALFSVGLYDVVVYSHSFHFSCKRECLRMKVCLYLSCFCLLGSKCVHLGQGTVCFLN